MTKRFFNIKIPAGLKERLDEMMKEENFTSFSDFVIHLLRKDVARYSAEKDGFQLSSDEEERIRQRLKELGYL